MSTLKASNIQDTNGNNNSTPAEISQGRAKAWVKFDGTLSNIGSGDNQFNVDDITDHGTGQYSANFTTAMPNANYAVAGMASDSGSGSVVALSFESATTSAVRVQCIRSTTGFSNQSVVNIIVFGD